jgi:hypothetical protein
MEGGMTDLRGHIAEAAAAKGLSIATLERYADEIGVPKDGRADDAQLAQILARIYSPGSGVPTASPAPEGAVSPSLPSGPALDPQALLESAQAIVGGEIVDVVPPELQVRIERARAKGKGKEEPETLAEQLRVEA